MEVTSVVVLIVGIILSFSGVLLGQIGSQSKRQSARVQELADSNAYRIGCLETQFARIENEEKNIAKDVKTILRKLEAHIGHRRHDSEDDEY